MFNQIMTDLAEKNIRGEERIAFWGLYAFSLKKNELDSECELEESYFSNLERLKKTLVSAHPQPLLIKALNYAYDSEKYSGLPLSVVKKDIDRRVKAMVQHLEKSPLITTSLCLRKISPEKKIFFYGDSSFVHRIAEKVVLSNSKNVISTLTGCFSDSELDFDRHLDLYAALSNASIAFFSCISVSSKGICVPVGTHAALIVAKHLKIPSYFIGNSLLLTDSVGEFIPKDDSLKIISDLGILSHKEFFKEAKKINLS